MTADRLPTILQAMQDDAHAAEDPILAAGLAACIDLHALAPLLPVNSTDAAFAVSLGELLTDGNDGAPLADADRAVACRVAARMASTAALLLAVDPAGHLSTAEALWSASGKLSGLFVATHKAMRSVERAESQRLITALKSATDELEALRNTTPTDIAAINAGPAGLLQVAPGHYVNHHAHDRTPAPNPTVHVSDIVGTVTTCPKCKVDNEVDEAARPVARAIDEGRLDEAADLLRDLERRYGSHPEIVRLRTCLALAKDDIAEAARPVQVGDVIDAASVPPGTLVDRQAPDGPQLTIRLANGRGYHLTPDDERCESWPWDERGPVRVLATDIRGAEVDRVAMMAPAEAREWLAQRIASAPIPEWERCIPGGNGVGFC